MAIITVITGSYCHGEEIIEEVSKRLNYRQIDRILLKNTSEKYNISKDEVFRATSGTGTSLIKSSQKNKRTLVYLESTLADLILSDNVIINGCVSFMIPGNISHVLKICIIANHDFRVEQAVKIENLSESDASEKIHEYDMKISGCSNYFTKSSAYDENLFDIMIPMHDTTVNAAVDLICNQALSDAVKTTNRSRQAAKDFSLAAKVKLELTLAGHNVNVFADNGNVNIEINESSIWMSKLEKKIKNIAGLVKGVNQIETKIGPKAAQPSLNPWDNVEMPPKILLVDDEKEFVHTLSERLKTRNLESSIAYDGEQALEMLKDDFPDVMVLDLMMPGIDGIETLRRVKAGHPDVEVIILTGHGSDKEKEIAEDLGAFAYLQKPVNINDLALKMKEAYKHSKRSR